MRDIVPINAVASKRRSADTNSRKPTASAASRHFPSPRAGSRPRSQPFVVAPPALGLKLVIDCATAHVPRPRVSLPSSTASPSTSEPGSVTRSCSAVSRKGIRPVQRRAQPRQRLGVPAPPASAPRVVVSRAPWRASRPVEIGSPGGALTFMQAIRLSASRDRTEGRCRHMPASISATASNCGRPSRWRNWRPGSAASRAGRSRPCCASHSAAMARATTLGCGRIRGAACRGHDRLAVQRDAPAAQSTGSTAAAFQNRRAFHSAHCAHSPIIRARSAKSFATGTSIRSSASAG